MLPESDHLRFHKRLNRTMRKHILNGLWQVRFIIAGAALFGAAAHVHADSLEEQLKQLLQKDSLTVLVTDSGLGGLSVAADVERRARTTNAYPHMRILFCNALADNGHGYNSMKTREEKIRVLSSALTGMTAWYHPDVILIACNTLSVLYAETEYARTSAIPVVGIVDLGVDLMAEKLQRDPASVALILGTPTTIAAGKHKEGLMKKGIAADRIVTQACKNLESEIQSDPASGTVRTMIDSYLSAALASSSHPGSPVVAGLCCTHYGYSIGAFDTTLRNRLKAPYEIVDPNPLMAQVLFPKEKTTIGKPADVTVQVVSRVVVTDEEKKSLGALLRQVSPATDAALSNFTLKRDLFEFSPNK
jgi:glutamate racemase